MGRVTTRRPVTRIDVGAELQGSTRADTLAVEEPLELRVGGQTLAVTMRTPGSDMELAAGFLLAEGVVSAASGITSMRYCAGTDESGRQTYNLLDIALADGIAPPDETVSRALLTSSSCGLCGAASIDAVRRSSAYEVAPDPLQVPADVIARLPETLRAAQSAFDRTGGLHAAGLFDASGRLLVCREDVGRHNAVDKVIGWALQNGEVPGRGRLLMVSGRASYELTQKALMAGIPLLAAVSAPSSLAVDLANEVGMTLLGFVRGATMNGYSGASRVVAAGSVVQSASA